MNRGDVWQLDLGGRAGRRPALVLTRQGVIAHLNKVTVAEITSVQSEESHGRWFLRVNWANKTAVFAYRGAFAEHLARVAETTIRSVMRPALPVLPQRRAAGA